MAPSPASSDSQQRSAGVPLSKTIRKVDHAVARLEELQCIVRTSHSNARYAKRSPPTVRSKLALHAGETFLNKNTGNGVQKCAEHASSNKPARPVTCGDHEQKGQRLQHIRSSKPNGIPVAVSRRTARVADFPPPPPYKQIRSLATDTRKDFLRHGRLKSPPNMSLSSPASSACSSSVQVVTRRARLNKDMASSEWPRKCSANVEPAHPNTASVKPPRTFFVHAGRANPNRPWCLSSSPSPAKNSSTTTSNYINSPSSNSSIPFPTKSPSRFSPLHRQVSGRGRESHQMQPLLCKSPECTVSKPTKASPNCPRRVPWLSQTRLSLPAPAPPSPGTKRSTRRFSLTSNRYRESPPRPLPALITRLPTRRKKALSPEKGSAATTKQKTHTSKGSTPNASPQDVPTGRLPNSIVLQSPSKRSTSLPIPPLPLPPALQALPSSSQLNPASRLFSQTKASHKRSSSCPRQCLLPLAEGVTNVNNCNLSSSRLPAKDMKSACFQSAGKENCFSGCGIAAWPCLRRSWSFSQRHSLENSNITVAGPYLLRHGKGYMQNGKDMSSQSQVYNVDSFSQERNRDPQKLYIG